MSRIRNDEQTMRAIHPLSPERGTRSVQLRLMRLKGGTPDRMSRSAARHAADGRVLEIGVPSPLGMEGAPLAVACCTSLVCGQAPRPPW